MGLPSGRGDGAEIRRVLVAHNARVAGRTTAGRKSVDATTDCTQYVFQRPRRILYFASDPKEVPVIAVDVQLEGLWHGGSNA